MIIKNCGLFLKSREIHNSDEVVNKPPEKRLCRFPNEIPSSLKPFGHYSLNACLQECIHRLEMSAANCTTHLMPEICNSIFKFVIFII